MILFYTNTAWFQTLITGKQPKTIQIPLLLPGVRPVSNLFKFKKKWAMGKGMLFNSRSIVGQMSTNWSVSLDWHLFNSRSIFGQMTTNSYASVANLLTVDRDGNWGADGVLSRSRILIEGINWQLITDVFSAHNLGRLVSRVDDLNKAWKVLHFVVVTCKLKTIFTISYYLLNVTWLIEVWL